MVLVANATVKPAPVAPPTNVPTLVMLDVTTLDARVVPVRVPAAAATVHVEPSVHVWLLTVVAGLARSALVTSPVAVNDPVTVVGPRALEPVTQKAFPPIVHPAIAMDADSLATP